MKKEDFNKAKPLFLKKESTEGEIKFLEQRIEDHYTETERLLELKEQLVAKLKIVDDTIEGI